MSAIIENWSELCNEPMSIEAIKSLHTPNESFLFRANSFQPGAKNIGGTSNSFIYAMKGGCKYWPLDEAQAHALVVKEGQRIWLPTGPLNFEVSSDSEFQYIVVVCLPKELKGAGFA